MSTLEIELNDYYKKIKKNLTCSKSIKKIFINDFKNRVGEYVDENPNVSIDDVINTFGTPNDIIKGFDNELDYYKKKARKRLIITITISVVSILVIGVLIFVLSDLINNRGGEITITTN